MKPVALASLIRFVLRGLDDSNSDQVSQRLIELNTHGVEGSILILQTCLDHLNVYERDLKNMQLEPFFLPVFKYFLDKPNFSTVFCESIRNKINEEFLDNFSNALGLSASERIAIGLALSDSENIDIRMCGKSFCMAQIAALSTPQMSLDSVDQIKQILMFPNKSECLSRHIDAFMQMLSLVQSKEGAQFILAPPFPDEVHEAQIFSNLDFFSGSDADDFDAVLAEMEKEMSMADVVKELGYGCTDSVSQCKEMLSMFSPLTEVTIARMLGAITRTYAGLEDTQNLLTFRSALGMSNASDVPSLNSWNANVLVTSIKELAPEINWTAVMENLDYEGFYVPNEAAFSLFMSIYNLACQDSFPLHAVCGSVWMNAEGQLSFIKYAVAVPPEIFSFAHSGRLLAYLDAVNGHKVQPGHANHAWLCLDLLEVLCQLAERGHATSVRSIINNPLEQCPEILLLGMAHVNTVFNLIQKEVASVVFAMILKNPVGNSTLLHLWHVNPGMLLWGFADAISTDQENVTRILESCLELKILPQVLDRIPSFFAIRLAALASRRESIDLEKWVSNNLDTYKDAFYEECLRFLKEVQLGAQEASVNRFQPSGALWNVYSETSSIFLKVLQSNTNFLSASHLSEEMEKLHVSYKNANSRPKNGAGADSSASDGYADDIESEANSYFHQMFSGQLTIDAMIQMLSRFKESPDKREHTIFECMIANLFEEYKFFSKYPERQLKIAAILFGSLIKHQLVTHLTLGIALRGVLDALRKPADSKMFVFGTKALEQFVDRMIEWPQYCNHILQISHLRASHPELVAFIERALVRISAAHSESDAVQIGANEQHGSAQEVPISSFSMIGSGPSQQGLQVSSAIQLPQRQQFSHDERKSPATVSTYLKPIVSSGGQSGPLASDTISIPKSQNAANALAPHSSPGFVRPSRSITSARFGSALNIETLVAAAERRETPIEAPASEIQDKISFIINNLSAANVEAKAKEFTEILKEQFYPWFAQYMVMKRASIEPNFHDLYLKFLDKVNSRPLHKEIVQATYENCKVLLGSELIKSSVEERSLLKNLGSWLGKITIGRNQVLRAREIDPKSLIIEAYEKGLMIAVIPFTSKILEPCQSSIAYQPPNPWTMGILGLLAEIYTMPNLKMNLKFDIEVLFKNLGVDLKEVPPTSLLKDRVREVEGNPDFSNKDVGSSQQIVGEVKTALMPPINQVELPPDVTGPAHPAAHPRVLSKYASPLPISSGTLAEEEKLAALGLPDQLPPTPSFLPGQSPFSVNQLNAPASNIEQQIVVNPKLHNLGLHVHFQRVLPHAIDQAVKEIVSNIKQRSVSIATQTTKELVLKDYAMETDESRIRSAAHLMVASLAGSLAHVTCKEPLRASISSQLRTTLQSFTIGNDLLEQAVLIVTNDNVDLGCAMIEQAATEKALQTIDGEMAHQLAIRRKQRETVGPAYFESTLYIGGLPEALRPKPGRLSISQQRVYEDFVRLPWQNQSNMSSTAVPVGPPSTSATGGVSRGYLSTSGQMGTVMYSSVATGSGISSGPPPLDFTPDELDTSLSQTQSGSGAQVGLGDMVSPHNLEGENLAATFPAVPAEPSPLDPANGAKEPGAAQLSVPERPGSSASELLLNPGDALDKYQIISEKLESLLAADAKEAEIQSVIAEVQTIIVRCRSRDEAALAMAQKAFKALYENASNTAHVNAHLAILAAIRDVSKLVVKELTSWVVYSEEERKYNKDITIGLIRSELLNLAEYNVQMAKFLDGGRNKAATEFAISLIHTLVINENRVVSELHNLVDAIAKVAARPGSPESLQQLVEIAKNPATANNFSGVLSIGKDDGTGQGREKKVTGPAPAIREEYGTGADPVEPDPVGFQEQVSMLFAEWCQLWELPGVNDAACAHFVSQLHQNGLLKGDDASDRFFRQLTELSVAHCLMGAAASQSQPLSFYAIDIYAKLVHSVLKFCPVDQGSSKLYLLSKVLGVTVKFIQRDAEEKKASFNPRPYFRLFMNWILDLSSLDPAFDGANLQVLIALAHAFHALQPLKVPGFSFVWLELVSHRSFMPKLLTGNGQKGGWPHIQRLLVDLFQFLEPFLRNAELTEPIHFLYKGTLRVLLVLLHDFPEFLCDYHFSFCDVIPPSCIQMRNIILSAFPRNMRLPDPSTPNLKIDLLAEINHSPRILSDVDGALKLKNLKNDIDEYLKARPQGSPFLSELKQKLLLSPNDANRAGTRYNAPLINSLVLYVGMQAVQQFQARTPPSGNAQHGMYLVGAAADIFQALTDLDTEGRYLFLNAVANQLRYPNNHTHYFSFVLLYLFVESNQEMIQEQITRVLLERLIVNRPHPWGLLITFIELIKNPRYNFWSRGFTRCAPEIEKLFESVSRSCGGPKPVEDSVVGGMPDNMH